MHDSALNYTASIHYDRRLYKQDIAGSMAHTRMLAKQGIISEADADAIVETLASDVSAAEATKT